MRILILGGYGVFGGRLTELLSDNPDLEILITGRSAQKAQAFCKQHRGAATLVPAVAERHTVKILLEAHHPHLLVDASGPFQEYGKDRYSVVEACLSSGTSYVDFADGSDFVFDIDRYDEAARSAGIFILSGVSSFPVLTAAVVREIGQDIDVRRVTGGIAPSPYAGVGLNVMRAVLGYAGAPVRLTRGGTETVAGGLCESLRYTVSPPGYLPLHSIRFSLVDVPDLRVIPHEFPEIADIWMGAGPVPWFLHVMLNGLAKLRWTLRIPSLTLLARLCHRVINHLAYGEHRGGMFIDIVGETPEGPASRSWHLLAEGDDGPYIPSMAIAIIVRQMLNGAAPEPGARPATNELTLSDYDDYFENRKIYTGFRSGTEEIGTLFQATLGDRFKELPRSLRDFHGHHEGSVWRGQAEVRAGKNRSSRVIARLFGFPIQDAVMDASVTVTVTEDGELWRREFGTTCFQSSLLSGRGREEHLVCERFGWVTIALGIVWDNERLWFVPRRWRIGSVPLPRLLLPKGRSFETDEDGMFAFDVRLELPVLGLIAAYKGRLRPDQ